MEIQPNTNSSTPEATPTPTEPLGTNSSQSATIPSSSPIDPTVATPQDLLQIIPEAYKAKPYMEGIDTIEKLFQKFDGAQTLIGKRPAGIPQNDSPKEEWDKFYQSVGRPESADKYEFGEAIKNIPRDEVLVKGVKEIFFEAGLSSHQAKTIQEKYDKMLSETVEAQTKEQDTAFDTMANETWGQNKQKVLTDTQTLLNKHTPEKFQDYIKDLDNSSLIVLASVLNNIKKEYINEDRPLGDSPGSPAKSKEEIRMEARQLMANPAYSNDFHPDHEMINKKVKDLYAQIP